MQAERKEMYAKLTYLTTKIKKSRPMFECYYTAKTCLLFSYTAFFDIVEKNKLLH